MLLHTDLVAGKADLQEGQEKEETYVQKEAKEREGRGCGREKGTGMGRKEKRRGGGEGKERYFPELEAPISFCNTTLLPHEFQKHTYVPRKNSFVG